MDQRVTSTTKNKVDLSLPASNFRAIFEALPIKVMTKDVAITRIMRICPHIDLVWLQNMPIDHLERVYRKRMEAFRVHSGLKTYVVGTEKEVLKKLKSVQKLFADYGQIDLLPEQRLDMDAVSELAEMSA